MNTESVIVMSHCFAKYKFTLQCKECYTRYEMPPLSLDK